MHISEQIAAKLIADGWAAVPDRTFFTKTILFPELAGTISNGKRLVLLEISENGRYLSRVDGWGNLEKDVDLRDFPNNPQGAIETVLKG